MYHVPREEFFGVSLRDFEPWRCFGSGVNCLPTVEVTATAILESNSSICYKSCLPFPKFKTLEKVEFIT